MAGSALATWLCDVQSEYGPECDDSPHFRRRDIDLLEATRLLNDSGFQFLPERDLHYVSWASSVCSGIYIGTTSDPILDSEGPSTGVLPAPAVGASSPEVFLHPRGCHVCQ